VDEAYRRNGPFGVAAQYYIFVPVYLSLPGTAISHAARTRTMDDAHDARPLYGNPVRSIKAESGKGGQVAGGRSRGCGRSTPARARRPRVLRAALTLARSLSP
jgi:hypothetical protein